jgi:hypothetical protein
MMRAAFRRRIYKEREPSLKPHALCLLLTGMTAALATVLPMSAHATNKLATPDVTKGKIDLEYRGGYDIDRDSEKNGNLMHKFVGGYGLTDWLRTEVKGILAEGDHGHDWTFVEWSNRFQILKGNEGFPKLAVQETYKFALRSGVPDKIESALLLSKETGAFTHVANLVFENELGSKAKEGTAFISAWKTKYRYDPIFEPGVELFMDFGRFGTKSSGTKKYQIGPVFSGKFTSGFKYETGFLAGFSQAAPSGRFIWIVGYDF